MVTKPSRTARCFATAALSLFALGVHAPRAAAAAPNLGSNEVPYAQDKPPGPALSPAEAMAKMQLPPGFKVELAAAEPDVVNPTAFTFDDRGRIWVCESVEYPRQTPGGGFDRVKILEDTDGDGKYEKVTLFKDGLNIPCGVAIGNGGVYVTNSPDILFLKDTDGDGKADTSETILTGFGRADTHELPNSLTWGPDGWLYGMNGVFNPAKVKDPASGKVYEFTCAIWRYHPPTKRFELFAEGTSNPWGLDYNRQGDWFISACVIDHLWHITQSGYYFRQGGPYPPNTIPINSITTQKHQKAAYAGLVMYDADVYPPEFRGKLLMGNLHGSAINADSLERNGSTYKQTGDPDFLQAEDAWFMPVSQKIGPDGCVYIMDWYDRYHCYQDANRDPKGLDRLKGRIYRINYKDTPRPKPFDLAKASPDELIKQLGNTNVWWRRTAQRLLNEKFDDSMVSQLQSLALSSDESTQAPMHALWLLVSRQKLDPAFHLKVLASPRAEVRNWGVKAVGEMGKADAQVLAKLVEMAKSEPSPDVRLQIPIAAGRLQPGDAMPLLQAMLLNPTNASDPLIPNILYQNLKPLGLQHGKAILSFFDASPAVEKSFGDTVVRWMREGVATSGMSPAEIVATLGPALAKPDADVRRTRQAMQGVINALGQLGLKHDERAKLFDDTVRGEVSAIAAGKSDARYPAIEMGLWWDDAKSLAAARQIITDKKADAAARSQLLKTLAERKDPANIATFAAFIRDRGSPMRLRKEAIDALGSANDAAAAKSLSDAYNDLQAELKPVVINALTRTPVSAAALLDAIASKAIPAADVTANHVRAVQALGDKAISARVTKTWGAVKTERDPARVQVVEQMRDVLRKHPGDPLRGQAVFTKTCAQCHVIYGQGGSGTGAAGGIGPDLTGVGRENVDAILANVLDPNLVIGAPYFVNVAKMKDGTVVSGVLIEDTPQRIVLKDQTKTYPLPRKDIARLVQQNISMMPEGLEKTMTEQEFTDLVAFLLTREPPKK
jgi:putative heme-binding domain-containing protein